MSIITEEELVDLLDEHDSPCVSIFQPMHRTYPERQQDPIEFRHLVNAVEESIRPNFPPARVRPVLRQLHALAANPAFWLEGRDGLAVLASPTTLHTFDLRPPVSTLALTADSFHIRPLIRTVQSAGRIQVLCLQRDQIELYEGNRDGLTKIKPAGVPLTVTEALGDAIAVQRKQQAYRGKSPGEPRPAPRGPGVPAGHPAKGGDAKLDAERFFRAIDRAILNHVSYPTELPLIVAALPEDWSLFRSISSNPHLVPTAIERSPASITEGQLQTEAWKCIEPHYLARLEKTIEKFQVARSRQLASDDLAEVLCAAAEGRVGVLLVEAETAEAAARNIGTATHHKRIAATVDDPLDDLAKLVLRKKGEVIVVPKQRMPTTTGLAAIFRF